jgi:hypothetical protein
MMLRKASVSIDKRTAVLLIPGASNAQREVREAD